MSGYHHMNGVPMYINPWAVVQPEATYTNWYPSNPMANANGFSFEEVQPIMQQAGHLALSPHAYGPYGMELTNPAWDQDMSSPTLPQIAPSTVAWAHTYSAPTPRPPSDPSPYAPEGPLRGAYTAQLPFHRPAPAIGQAGLPFRMHNENSSSPWGFCHRQPYESAPYGVSGTSQYGYPQASDAGQFSFAGSMTTPQGTATSWPDMAFDSSEQTDEAAGMYYNTPHSQRGPPVSSAYPDGYEQAFYLVEEPPIGPLSPQDRPSNSYQNAHFCSGPASYSSQAECVRPLKRPSEWEDVDLNESPHKRLKRDSSEGCTSRQDSERGKASSSTTQSNAWQTLSATFQGDGDETLSRRPVEHESSRTHVLEMSTNKSGTGQQVGASNEAKSKQQRLREEEERCMTKTGQICLQQKRIIEGGIGMPAPDLRHLAQGLRTLKEVRKEVATMQICRYRSKRTECCGHVIDGSHNAWERHCSTKHARGYTPLGRGQDKRLVRCPQPGCREEFNRVNLDFHLRKVQHLLADLRFLRLECPNKDCPMGINEFVPGSKWFHDRMKEHRNSSCPYKGPEYRWQVVDEEPSLDDYPISGKPKKAPVERSGKRREAETLQ